METSFVRGVGLLVIMLIIASLGAIPLGIAFGYIVDRFSKMRGDVILIPYSDVLRGAKDTVIDKLISIARKIKNIIN